MQLVTYDQVESKIIDFRGQKVILDNDVAELYKGSCGRTGRFRYFRFKLTADQS